MSVKPLQFHNYPYQFGLKKIIWAMVRNNSCGAKAASGTFVTGDTT
jgi:hypothetical protein